MAPSEDQDSQARAQRAPRKGSRVRILGAVLTALSLAGIALGTLLAAPDLRRQVAETPLWCLVCGDVGLTDAIQNIFFFVPLGISLSLLGLRWRRAVLIGALVAVTVELLQLFVVAGRDASLSDLITNTLGTALGAGALEAIRASGFPAPTAARRLLLSTVGAVAALWALGAWLLAPDVGSEPWIAVIKPSVTDHTTYPGPVDSVLVGGEAVRGTTVLSRGVVEEYARTTLTVALRMAAPGPRQHGALLLVGRSGEGWSGPPRAGGAPLPDDAQLVIGRTYARSGPDRPSPDHLSPTRWREPGDRRQLLVAATQSGSAKVTFRIRASRLRLQPLRFYAARAFVAPAGAPISLDITRTRRDVRISGQVGDLSYQSQQELGPQWLLALVSPIPGWAGPEWTAMAFLWVAGGFGVAGLAAARAQASGARSGRLAPGAWAPILALAIWMSVVNLIAGYPAVPVVGWVMCALGVAGGALIGRRKE